MIAKRSNDGIWMVATQGALRPIVAEADTMHKALLALAEMVHAQKAEEYAMVQSMSHLADVSYGQGAYGKDWG